MGTRELPLDPPDLFAAPLLGPVEQLAETRGGTEGLGRIVAEAGAAKDEVVKMHYSFFSNQLGERRPLRRAVCLQNG